MVDSAQDATRRVVLEGWEPDGWAGAQREQELGEGSEFRLKKGEVGQSRRRRDQA